MSQWWRNSWRDSSSLCQVILLPQKADNIPQQALANASIDDFLIVEYLGDLGGRVAHITFGAQSDGTPYIVELGANWVCSRHVLYLRWRLI